MSFSDENDAKKWLISPPISALQQQQQQQQSKQQNNLTGNKCPECEKLQEIINEYIRQLDDEKRAMDETIIMIEKLERDHKDEVSELKILLNFEKDKVVGLQKSLENERKARIEDLYKQDRERKDLTHITKDYELVNNLNQNMITEFETLKNENFQLTTSIKSLQDNKQTIMIELKKYEDQVNELEAVNQSFRKRLYETESSRDKLQILVEKLKVKVSKLSAETMSTMTGSGLKSTNRQSNSSHKKKFQPTASLHPIQSTQSTRWPNEHNQSAFQSSTMSSSHHSTRISELSALTMIRKFNSDPKTISNSQQRSPTLWPISHRL